MISKVETATRFAEDVAANNRHGYSQANRWGEPDYDCSSLVISAWEYAGVPVKSRGATYTGNMLGVFLACGFKTVTTGINLLTGAGLKRGDVLLNVVSHAAMYTGNGKVVHARSSEGSSIPGDQSGNEIRVQSYWNYPWDYVLRYPEVINYDDEPADNSEDEDLIDDGGKTRAYPELKYGSGLDNPLPEVKAWQNLLLCWGYNLGRAGADGEFGTITHEQTMMFQKRVGLEATGIVNEESWKQAIYIER